MEPDAGGTNDISRRKEIIDGIKGRIKELERGTRIPIGKYYDPKRAKRHELVRWAMKLCQRTFKRSCKAIRALDVLAPWATDWPRGIEHVLPALHDVEQAIDRALRELDALDDELDLRAHPHLSMSEAEFDAQCLQADAADERRKMELAQLRERLRRLELSDE